MSIGTVTTVQSTTPDSPHPTPAAWYVDPADPTLLRWWSGAGWTEHTSPRPAPILSAPEPATSAEVPAPIPTATPTSTAAPTQPSASGAPLSRRELRARMHTSAGVADGARLGERRADATRQLTASFALRDETGFVDLATARTPVSVFTPLWPTRVHTFAAWLVAVMPLGWAVAEHASGLLLSSADLLTIRIALTAAFLVITLLCAFRDSHLLRLGGHSDTASPWWVLLTPFAYLVARTVRVRQETRVRAPAAVWVWLIATLPMIALLSGVRSIEELVPAF